MAIWILPLKASKTGRLRFSTRRAWCAFPSFARRRVTATTVSRMLEKGLIARLGRGLYQLADAQLDVNHSLAEAAEPAPKGVICLTSALACHDLTDTIPPPRVDGDGLQRTGGRAIKPAPKEDSTEFVRFGPKVLRVLASKSTWSRGVPRSGLRRRQDHRRSLPLPSACRASATATAPDSISRLKGCARGCDSAKRRPPRSPATPARPKSGKSWSRMSTP